jgi:hypothetical protein
MRKLSSIALVLLASACDPSLPPITEAPGQYRGVLAHSRTDAYEQFLVRAEVSAATGAALAIAVTPEGSAPLSLQASLRQDRLTIEAPGLLSEARELRLAEEGCFVGETPGNRACYDGHEVLVELAATSQGDFSLVLERYDPAGDPVLEAPEAFTADQLRDRAIGRSFESRIEFERVLQARLAARVAHFNLLPNFTLNTIIGLASLDTSSLVRSIGNLAPFLLPTRWMRARQASQQASAERHAWNAMKADAGSIAEGIALAILRDERSLAILASHRASVDGIREQVRGFERLGIVAEGASEDLTSLLDATDLSMQGLGTVVFQEKAALAMAAGFVNPRAIAALAPGRMADPEEAAPLDEVELSRIALLRSFELRQMDALIAQARSSRTQRIFGWIDPSGDGAGSLGFGIADYVRIGSSQVAELELKRQQLQAVLLQKVAIAVAEARGAAASYRTARFDVELQERRLARLTGNLRLGISVSLVELVGAMQARMKSDLDVNGAEFGYRAARSRIDRLVLTGAYADVERN